MPDKKYVKMTKEEYATWIRIKNLLINKMQNNLEETDEKKPDKKSITWTDIENNIKHSTQNNPSETDKEKLVYFKEKILNHLDNFQKEEDKKIIPFPKKSKRKSGN